MGDQGAGCGCLLMRAWGFLPFYYPPLLMVPLLFWVGKVIAALREEFLSIKQRYVNILTGFVNPSWLLGCRQRPQQGPQDLLADKRRGRGGMQKGQVRLEQSQAPEANPSSPSSSPATPGQCTPMRSHNHLQLGGPGLP